MTDYKDNEILTYLKTADVERQGIAHVLLMWWDLDMDKHGEIVLRMAPKWMNEDKAKRDEVFAEYYTHKTSSFNYNALSEQNK